MSVVRSFEDLQALGVNSIHERTHIARAKLEQLLNKSFGDLTRVQFMGFVSILEREYDADLTHLRDEYDFAFPLELKTNDVSSSVIFKTNSKARMLWTGVTLVGIFALMVAGYFVQGSVSVAPNEEMLELNDKLVVAPDKTINDNNSVGVSDLNVTNIAVLSDVNTSLIEHNASNVLEDKQDSLEVDNVISIKPKSKVWVGMMDLTTEKKTQYVTSDSIVLDSSKTWLLIFGHGRLEIVSSSGNKVIKERNAIWFVYDHGRLKRLSEEEFKEKNHGSDW